MRGPILARGKRAHEAAVHGVDRHGGVAVNGQHALYAVRLAVVDDVEVAPAAVALEHLMARGVHLERHQRGVVQPGKGVALAGGGRRGILPGREVDGIQSHAVGKRVVIRHETGRQRHLFQRRAALEGAHRAAQGRAAECVRV